MRESRKQRKSRVSLQRQRRRQARPHHGSLEGVVGLKTNEVYHSKADALVILEMYFLKIFRRLFGNVVFIKLGTFPLCLRYGRDTGGIRANRRSSAS